jgi:hypothetical protein
MFLSMGLDASRFLFVFTDLSRHQQPQDIQSEVLEGSDELEWNA